MPELQDCIADYNVLPKMKLYVKIESTFDEAQAHHRVGQYLLVCPNGFHSSGKEQIDSVGNRRNSVVQQFHEVLGLRHCPFDRSFVPQLHEAALMQPGHQERPIFRIFNYILEENGSNYYFTRIFIFLFLSTFF